MQGSEHAALPVIKHSSVFHCKSQTVYQKVAAASVQAQDSIGCSADFLQRKHQHASLQQARDKYYSQRCHQMPVSSIGFPHRARRLDGERSGDRH